MSYDESLHTYFSWLLYRGQGYEHSPMMHGPFQFHIVALTYFLFGANDFTSRIPAVLFSIATVWMVWYWRRYLGKWGALIAGFLLVISPYMLYYGRYVRNESFVGFSGIVMLYAILRHLEVGGKKYLLLLAGCACTALHIKRNILHLHRTGIALPCHLFHCTGHTASLEKCGKGLSFLYHCARHRSFIRRINSRIWTFHPRHIHSHRDRDCHAKRPQRDGHRLLPRPKLVLFPPH